MSSEPHSSLFDGAPYGLVMDRILRPLHRKIARNAPTHGRVLDACCGPGGLSLLLAKQCDEVVGVDISPRHIRYAERRRIRHGVENLRFEAADASRLESFETGSFDAACVVMAIHEMPVASRVPVLRELGRVALEVIAVDFQIPMPRNLAGWRNRGIEFLAGGEHFRNFRDFSQRGGLDEVVREAGLDVARSRTMDAGALTMQFLQAP